MKLNDVFTKAVVTASPGTTLSAVACQMRDHNVGAVVVVEGRRPVGLITDRDVALALGAQGVSPDAPVEKVMTRHVLAIPEDTGIYTVTRFMREREVRRLPIVDREDRLVGMVTLDDLLRVVAGELCNLAEGIRHEMEVK